MLYRRFADRLCVLAALAMFAGACGGSDEGSGASPTTARSDATAPAGEPIIIGLQSDQTGPGASFNTPSAALIKALVDELNDNGGLLGRPVEIVEGNDESDPTKSPTVLRGLVDEGAEFLFHLSGGAAMNQAKPLTSELELPTLGPTQSGDVYPNPPDNNYVYTLAPPSSSWAQVYCSSMESAGIRTLAVLTDDTPAIASFSKSVLENLPCVEIVASETAAVNVADLSAQIARIKSAEPDAVMTFSAGSTFEITAQNALFEQMPDVPRLMTAALGNDPDAWKVPNPGALNGAAFITTIDPENGYSTEVGERMKELVGDDFSLTQFTAQTYDAFHIFVEAVRAAGTMDGVKVNEAIQQITDYRAAFGPEGTTVSFSADRHIGADCALLLIEFGENNEPVGPWEFFKPQC